jgi:prevent-host-death family protein
MYNSKIMRKKIPLSQARAHLSELIKDVYVHDVVYEITIHGRITAVLRAHETWRKATKTRMSRQVEKLFQQLTELIDQA